MLKPVVIIAIAVGCSVAVVFLISEVSWYFPGQEVEKAQEELRENLEETFNKEYDASQIQILPETQNESQEFVDRYDKVLQSTCANMYEVDSEEYLECINP